MTIEDVPDIVLLEKICFPEDPWPANVYIEELTQDPNSFYWIVRPTLPIQGRELPKILANGGYRIEESYAHITTLATHPHWRRRKIGEWLLLSMLKMARESRAEFSLLEVRVDNTAAINMYFNLGFLPVNKLKHYYRGDKGDAYVLVLYDLDKLSVWLPLQKILNAIVIDLSQ
jgi:ribosomal-protein-alanine N-acetyltransferase